MLEVYSQISSDAIQSISKETARKYKVVPFNVADSYIDVYAQSENVEFADEQELLTGQFVNFTVVDQNQCTTRKRMTF